MVKEQPLKKRGMPINVTMEEILETENVLARTLKMLRMMDGFTQEEVAKLIGTNPVTVSHWETGLKVPGPGYLTALAKLYGVEVGHLFGVPVEKKKRK